MLLSLFLGNPERISHLSIGTKRSSATRRFLSHPLGIMRSWTSGIPPEDVRAAARVVDAAPPGCLRRSRREQLPWPIHLDDFMLHGPSRSRTRAQSVWVYKHRALGPRAQPRRRRVRRTSSRGTPNGKSYGRFTACDIRTAIYQADLPDVRRSGLVRRAAPPGAAAVAGSRFTARTPDARRSRQARRRPAGRAPDPAPSPPGARRGHLTLIRGGRQAG